MSCGKPCACPSYRDHCLSISVSASAMPTRSPEAAAVNKREAQWDKDMPAYRRMRDEGLQPKHVDGAHEIEARATDRIEVESGRLYGKHLSLAKDAQALVAETKERT